MSPYFEMRKLHIRVNRLSGSELLVSVKAKAEIQDSPCNTAPIPLPHADLCNAFWGRMRTASDHHASIQIPSIPSIIFNRRTKKEHFLFLCVFRTKHNHPKYLQLYNAIR